MKGYIVKYSTGSYDDYCVHTARVYLDVKEAGRYVDKFNSIMESAKTFYDNLVVKDKYGYPNIDENTSQKEFEYINKYYWYKDDIGQAWLEEIEVVEPVKKKGNPRWD